jgi:hypothetical protein
MLTREEAQGLEVNDLIEVSPIFPALGKEPVLLRVAQVAQDRAEFVVTYFGVTIGKWVCQFGKEELQWTFG